MEFTIGLELAGWAVLIVGAVVIGAALQMLGEPEWGYEWIVTAIAAGIGALVASEFIVGWRTFEPVFGGLATVPALLGGVVVGAMAAFATRQLTRGAYRTSPAR